MVEHQFGRAEQPLKRFRPCRWTPGAAACHVDHLHGETFEGALPGCLEELDARGIEFAMCGAGFGSWYAFLSCGPIRKSMSNPNLWKIKS